MSCPENIREEQAIEIEISNLRFQISEAYFAGAL
jgi:hypothetical protein